MLLKKKIVEKPLFRQCKNIVKNIQIFDKQALTDSILRSQIINLKNIIDIELFTDLYIFRRGNKQALDNSNK